MEAFFWLSKLGGMLLAPSNLLLAGIATGLALHLSWRTARVGRALVVVGLAALLLVVSVPIGDRLARPLEQRYPAHRGCAVPVAGIIVLGGGVEPVRVGPRYEEDLGEAADRLRHAARLARRYPHVPVLLSGGQVVPRPGARSEAHAMAAVLTEFGVASSRLRLETASRTTAENAAGVARAVDHQAGAYLLVTSAFHMPRAMGAFAAAGVPVSAAPTDWRFGDDPLPAFLVTAGARLSSLDLIAREYLGLAAYRLSGRSRALFPGPDLDACAHPPSGQAGASGV